jgi:hypothetical protein
MLTLPGDELDNPASPYSSLLLPVEKEFLRKCLAVDLAVRCDPAKLTIHRYLQRWKPLQDLT